MAAWRHLATGTKALSSQSLYLPLWLPNFLRLLKLLPGVCEEPVRCHIAEYELSSRPLYEALSYCWGKVVKSKTITCNCKSVGITENPHDDY